MFLGFFQIYIFKSPWTNLVNSMNWLTESCSGLLSKILSSLKLLLKLIFFKLFLIVFLLCWKDNFTILKNKVSSHPNPISSFLLNVITAEFTFGGGINRWLETSNKNWLQKKLESKPKEFHIFLILPIHIFFLQLHIETYHTFHWLYFYFLKF